MVGSVLLLALDKRAGVIPPMSEWVEMVRRMPAIVEAVTIGLCDPLAGFNACGWVFAHRYIDQSDAGSEV